VYATTILEKIDLLLGILEGIGNLVIKERQSTMSQPKDDYLVPLLRKRQQVSDILEENLSYGKL